MGFSKEVQAKKPSKSQSAHNARPVELPKEVDWDEQKRLKSTLQGAYIPPMTTSAMKSMYNPEIGVKLCMLRLKGYSQREVCAETGFAHTTLQKWRRDYPEFAQEWNDCYKDHLTDTAEELLRRTEMLLDGKMPGVRKKLSKLQEKRYIKALELHQAEVHWAAARRVPELYGTEDTGSELVLVQPTNIPERSVTQAPDQATSYLAEVEDAREASDEGADRADPGSGLDDRQDNSRGLGQAESDGSSMLTDVGRDPGGSCGIPESTEPQPDEEPGLESGGILERNPDSNSPEQPA